MSFDIVIATRRPPTRAMVESYLSESGWRLSLEGDLTGETANLVAESHGIVRREHIFVLSGPDPAEREDLPIPVRRVLRGPAYLSEMNLPWGLAEKQKRRAVALCEYLARTCDGAVFDPQDDRLVFPVVSAERPQEPALTSIRQLSLEWYLAPAEAEDGSRFLAAIRRIWPDAVPTRFGPYEPLRFKMAAQDGEATFLEQWLPANSPLFWKAKKPFFGGSIFWSGKDPPAGMQARVAVSLSLNATAIENDPVLCDRAVELFAAVGGDLGAFFGAGYIIRGVLRTTGGAPRYGPGTERFWDDWIYGPWWLGLPSKPTWLTWFGPPYRDLIAASLKDVTESRQSGTLVRLGPTPMDADQLVGRAPRLPSDLLFGLEPRPGNGPLQNIALYRRTPARIIPSME